MAGLNLLFLLTSLLITYLRYLTSQIRCLAHVVSNPLLSLARGRSLSKYLLPRVPSLSKYLLPRGPSLSKYCHNVESTEGIVSLLDGAGAHVKVLVPGNVLQLLEVLVNG